MPRNRSEQIPHPELPKRFHERMRLHALGMVEGDERLPLDSRRHSDAYTRYVATFDSTEAVQYWSIPEAVREVCCLYYKEQAQLHFEAELREDEALAKEVSMRT